MITLAKKSFLTGTLRFVVIVMVFWGAIGIVLPIIPRGIYRCRRQWLLLLHLFPLASQGTALVGIKQLWMTHAMTLLIYLEPFPGRNSSRGIPRCIRIAQIFR